VGGGMELLQFSYFSRKKGAVIGVDVVDEMLVACADNLLVAQKENWWFKTEYVELRKGSALALPVNDASIDIAAQNCLFNIFKQDDLKKALEEMYRVLKPNGRLILSDPICDQEMPESLLNDEKLRALCLSGAIPLKAYIDLLTATGFGTIEIRARRPYRVLAPGHYDTTQNLFIESVEVCAIKDPMPADGPCVFTGKSAIYFGKEEFLDDKNGHIMMYNQPLSICDKTAAALASLNRDDIMITDSTYFYDGGGCC
jgi:SAM-dependent methyltransferase